MKKSIPNFLSIFEIKLNALKDSIKAEYKNRKHQKTKLKQLVKEAKQLRNALRQAQQEHQLKCPHCGKAI